MVNNKDLAVLGEEELLKKYEETGEMGYFGELYNRYIPLIYGVYLKYLPNTQSAQNAVMQFFEELLPKIAESYTENFKTWLYTALKNNCLQILRKDNKEITIDFNSGNVESEEVLQLLYDEVEDKSTLDDLRRCMDRLPDNQRICITHFFMKKMSYIDIVDKTGYSFNAVKNNIRNGKRNLKICLNRNAK